MMSEQQEWMLEERYLSPGPEGVPAIDLPFDFKNARRFWEDKYGITEIPLLVKSADGTVYDDRRLKGIFVNGKYKRMVSRNYVVFPNEEVNELVQELAAKNNLEIQRVDVSHHGDAAYWQLLSKSMDKYIEYKGKNDAIKVGCVIRNSVGAGVALGADLFTYRVFCSNGAVARGNDMGFSLKHVIAHDLMLEIFMDKIKKIIEQTGELIEYYQKAAQLRMNKRIAEEIAKRIPQKSFPKCMTYDYKNKQVILTRQDDLWTAFNDVTQAVWHDDKSHYLKKSGQEQALHRILVNAVDGRYQ